MDAIEATILQLLAARAPDGSICPSEVARALWPEDWRQHMGDVRNAAAKLKAKGQIQATQKGHVVDLSTAKGPIRLALFARSSHRPAP